MGAAKSAISNAFGGVEAPSIGVLMLGLDAAGKTTMLYTLKLGEVITTIPTIGFNIETVQGEGLSFTVWDVGGKDKIRALWRHYYQDKSGLIFVIDSNDQERLQDARSELCRAIDEPDLADVPVLVLANKQDLPRAQSSTEISDAMSLETSGVRRWHVQGTCAKTGEGVREGLSWLTEASRSALNDPLLGVGQYLVKAPLHAYESPDAIMPVRSKLIEMGETVDVVEVAINRGGKPRGRIETPAACWIPLTPRWLSLPKLIVTLAVDIVGDAHISLSCCNLAGTQLTAFDLHDPDDKTIADLLEALRRHLEMAQDSFNIVTADGRQLTDIPSDESVSRALCS